MNVIVVPNADEMSKAAAQYVMESAASSVVPAMGNTPQGTYMLLGLMRKHGKFDSSALRVIQLDEYLNIPHSDERSLYGWLDRSFIQPLGIDPANVISFSDTLDGDTACREFDARVVAAGGIDLAVMGLGSNGHLGYNEPPADADSPTRVVPLTEESITSAVAYWGARDRVPTHGMTLGMNRLLAAKQLLLLVSGAQKRDILHKVLHGEITPDVPASYLRQAANVTVIADRAALPDGAAA